MSTTVNDAGVILSVDIQSEGSFGQIVIPLANQAGEAINKERFCRNAVFAFVNDARDKLLDCMSVNASIIGVGATGMVNGMVPYRENYAVDAFPGTNEPGEDVEPSSISVIALYYPNMEDYGPIGTFRLRSGRNYIFGVPETETGGNVITSGMKALVEEFAEAFITGIVYDDTGEGGENITWNRVVNAVRGAAGQTIYFASSFVVKSIVGSVSRRLRPPKR